MRLSLTKLENSSFIHAVGMDKKKNLIFVMFLNDLKTVHVYELDKMSFSMAEKVIEKRTEKFGVYFSNFIRPKNFHIAESELSI